MSETIPVPENTGDRPPEETVLRAKSRSDRSIIGIANGEPMGVARGLVKQFGKLYAVNKLSMTINAGETFSLIGPNGAGKTTLIRILVGVIRPASGTIEIMGELIP